MNYLLVALGGAIGGAARYFLDTSVRGLANNPDFPLGMFFVNVSGAFLIGVAFGLSQKEFLSSRVWLLLVVGFLGAYTSFSDFTLESLRHFTEGKYGEVILNLLTGPAGIIAVILGVLLMRGLRGMRDTA